jgi:hypothetical protein
MVGTARTRSSKVSLAAVLVCAFGTVLAGTCSAAPSMGKLAGVVVDPAGVPQMGANVKVMAEDLGVPMSALVLTNQHGVFNEARLPAGLYEVQVTLAGFLPSIQHGIRVTANVTTIVKVQLNTVFSSLDRLRHGPDQTATSDDWKWALRTAAATRPVMQWTDPQSSGSSLDDESGDRKSRGQLELTSGSQQPGSISNLPEAPASAFSYDLPVGTVGRLFIAGEASYGRELPAGGLATVWLPAGNDTNGPVTEVVVRETWLGPTGLVFRGERVSAHDSLQIGDRILLHYGADTIAAQLGRDTQSIRPVVDMEVLVSRNLTANMMVVSGAASTDLAFMTPPSTATDLLDSFPVLMLRNSRPVIDGGWHEETGLQYKLSPRASLEGAAFHDHSADSAVFGSGSVTNPDFLQDPFSNAFVYDAGSMDSWGARAAFKEKLTDNYDLAFVYAYAGAMAAEPGDGALASSLRDAIDLRYRHSLGARFSGRSRRTGTQFSVGYKWISGQTLTRQDAYGETLYDLDPYLGIRIRQHLPGSIGGCRWEALADFRNLLGQGYVPVSSQDGQVLLMSAARSFRGGISFQF